MTDITDAIEDARRRWNSDDPATGQTLDALRAAAAAAPPARSLAELLSADELALIVEPKRATARQGEINPDHDIAGLAAECEAAGASAICIVTEQQLSMGSVEDVVAARSGSQLLTIARDFVVDVRQVYALRAAGADALLVPALAHVEHEPGVNEAEEGATDTLAAIVHAAHGLGMDVVLSVQTDEELAFALETDADVLNIDNRDDHGTIDVERTFELLADVPVGWPVISESIAAIDQVARLQRAGVDALLLDEGHVDTGLTHALAVYAGRSLDA